MPTEIVMVLVGCSTAFAVTFLGAFIWAVKTGQFEDRTTPAMRILLDDKE
ncbi:MAG: cbb3-type cytochrome oxidase assembly protein CcoS [Bacteroidota bacterium]|nr:cbb3-type cytochrome oxidase assembly protein CcoS [Candidatus Kapabacteria bacterium]MDW8220427.1 cbb3-type cytochrome oxidase assembly protein CcoS [Bacteroidota bacterium]